MQARWRGTQHAGIVPISFFLFCFYHSTSTSLPLHLSQHNKKEFGSSILFGALIRWCVLCLCLCLCLYLCFCVCMCVLKGIDILISGLGSWGLSLLLSVFFEVWSFFGGGIQIVPTCPSRSSGWASPPWARVRKGEARLNGVRARWEQNENRLSEGEQSDSLTKSANDDREKRLCSDQLNWICRRQRIYFKIIERVWMIYFVSH